MARRYPEMVTIKEIVAKERFSLTYIEKILQSLREGNIVISHKGKQGGYSLAKPPEKITLREVIEALEGKTFDVYCEPEIRSHIVCTHFCMCGIRPIWQKTKTLLDQFFDSVTLATVSREEPQVMGVMAK
jgi:Rrf2 family protein